ncbi:MAG: RsmE family RNA methyltransferase [Pseudomonadota bacterium]
MTIPRLFEKTDAAVGGRHTLNSENARIVKNVLRLQKGDRVELIDGAGGVAIATLLEVGRTRSTAAILDRKEVAPAWPEIILIQGLPKGEKAGWIVQKGVELGVRRICFFESARTIGKRGPGQAARWTRIAIEAARQSGNAHLPEIVGPIPLPEALNGVSSVKLSVFLDEAEKSRRFRDLLGTEVPPSIGLAVGPEGGWSDADRELLRGHGFASVTFGPLVMRTETAAVAAVAACRAWLP